MTIYPYINNVKKYIPFIAIIFALIGIIFTYEWMFQGQAFAYLSSFNRHGNFANFRGDLVKNPKLITWLIFMVIKTTSYFVLFPYLLFKLFNSKQIIIKSKDYIIFSIGAVAIIECTTLYGSSMFENLRDLGFPSTLYEFGESQDLISLFWGVISALLFALIFQYPFMLNNEMENFEKKILLPGDEIEKTAIIKQHIGDIYKLKNKMDSYFYILGFIIALSEISFAALREAAVVGNSATAFPIEVVYYHGLFQSLLIAIVYVPFNYYFKTKAQTINYKGDDEYSRQLLLITDFRLNIGALKKIVPVISPLIGAAVPALFNHIFS